jgi:hypothetical protein
VAQKDEHWHFFVQTQVSGALCEPLHRVSYEPRAPLKDSLMILGFLALAIEMQVSQNGWKITSFGGGCAESSGREYVCVQRAHG